MTDAKALYEQLYFVYNHTECCVEYTVTPQPMSKKKDQKAIAKKRHAVSQSFPDIEDATLGPLKFTAHLDGPQLEYEGSRVIDGHTISIVLYSNTELELGPTLHRTKELLRKHSTMMRRATKYVRTAFVPQYNASLQSNASEWPPLDPASVASQLTLSTVMVHADGSASYWFDMGDVLHGHGLVLYLSSDSRFIGSDEAG